MNETEARELTYGDIVQLGDYHADTGIVDDVTSMGFHVIWYNGQEGWISYDDATDILLLGSV